MLRYLIACLIVSQATLHAETHRVPADYASVQDAVSAAAGGDIVLVAAGVYELDSPISFSGKGIHLRSEEGADSTLLRMEGAADPRRASILIFENEEPDTAIVEGFTLQAGKGTELDRDIEGFRKLGQFGGAVFCGKNSRPRFQNNVFLANTAAFGAAVFVDTDAEAVFSGNRFVENPFGAILALDGGKVDMSGDSFIGNLREPCIWSDSGTVIVLEDAEFASNTSTRSSIVRHRGDFISVSRCTFRENQSAGAGALDIITSNPSQIASVQDCEFRFNQGDSGGAIAANATNDGFRPIRISQCRFLGNRGLDGGAIQISPTSSLVLVDRCKFIGNAAAGQGGAISHGRGADSRVQNCAFIGNMAEIGGALLVGSASTEVQHCVIVGNAASRGGGIDSFSSRANVGASIIWGNSGFDLRGPIRLERSCIGTFTDDLVGEHVRFDNPKLVGWKSNTHTIDARAKPGGDGSAENPYPDFFALLDAFSFDLAKDSPCAELGETRAGLATAKLAPQAFHSTSRANVLRGRYRTAAMSLLEVVGEDRYSVFLEGRVSGLREGRKLAHVTITSGLDLGLSINSEDQATVHDCTITKNAGPALVAHPGSTLSMEDCTISKISGLASIRAREANLSFSRCRVTGNFSGQAGLVDIESCRASFTNCLINACRAERNALFVISDSDLRFMHCTVAQNSSPRLFSCTDVRPSTVRVDNSVFSESGDPNECADLFDSFWVGPSPFVRDANVDLFRVDQELVAGSWIDLPDYVIAPGDYHLSKLAPGFDQAAPNRAVQLDIEGNSRPCGNGVDAGAFEAGECFGENQLFKRGDLDADGRLSIADSIASLGYLFLGRSEPTCLDSGDSDDDGDLTVSDAIATLQFLFLGGAAPEAPFAECGLDRTIDGLTCREFAACDV